MILLNPSKHDRTYLDRRSQEIMRKTIAFFEGKGRGKIKRDDHERAWYSDFLEFQQKEGLFATLLTPRPYAAGDPDARWDTYRNCEFNEILAFYGLAYWYTWQVTILGLGPIWMSRNQAVKERTAQLLREGGIFAFGLSEKEHGADLYSTEMALVRQADGTFRAKGRKYYIGNANEAAFVSTFGKLSDSGDYVWFVVGSKHGKYECVKNVVNSQSFVAEYALHDYPITDAEILSTGRDAWDAALNTVNVGKFNLGWASIGICTHALYESIDHAAGRVLYGKHVTEFAQVKQLFSDAYCRLVAMKLFASRASDYMRAASAEDRRYLLYNPIVKMKVTTQGERVIDHLWDVISAKGFEKDAYFEMAARTSGLLLEGTVHVNMASSSSSRATTSSTRLSSPGPKRDGLENDDFLFQQGPTKGLGRIQFHDYRIAYQSVDIPNVHLFVEQVETFKEFLTQATPTQEQAADLDFLLTLGELFTLVPYGQLILENKRIYDVEDEVIDQIFDVLVRDFSKYALELYSKTSSSSRQMELCLKMIRKPVVDTARFERVLERHVYSLKGAYTMTD
jgi:acyl-CoA dehydrogenase